MASMKGIRSKMAKFVSEPGYVWCDRLGEIHEDELDPYCYGEPKEGEYDERCRKADHRPVYIRRRPEELPLRG